MADIQDGGYSSGLYKKMVCPLYIHSTKKAHFVRLRGCPYAPYIWMALFMFGCPHIPPCMFGHPHMFGCPLCLDAPCMLGHPHRYGCLHMFGCCLDAPCTYTTQKACFVRLRGVHMSPYIWMSPVHKQHNESMLCQTKGVSICPPYIWMPPYAWMHPMYV